MRELALRLVRLYVGNGGTGLLAETAHRPQVALRVLAIRSRVDVQDPNEIPVAGQGDAQCAGRAILFVIIAVVAPVELAVHQHGLTGRCNPAGDAVAEIDSRPTGGAPPFRADGSKLVLGAHHHDRTSLRVEKFQRACEDGLENLIKVESKVELLA